MSQRNRAEIGRLRRGSCASYFNECSMYREPSLPTNLPVMLLCPGCHLLAARNYRKVMRRHFAQWSEVIYLVFACQ
jgi:hypothetical protein